MAEFVEKRCEDMIPQMEQMERTKLFEKNEVKEIAKKRKEFEYKIQRHQKNKEDFLRYIQYEMDLLKLVKERRKKLQINAKKNDIDYSIANKINSLYKAAIFRFQDDFRFWIAYMTFCKQVKFKACVSRMIGKMIQAHQNNPKCWHIASKWEMEENKNLDNAKKYIFAGLRTHPDSQLLYTDLFTLELKQMELNTTESKKIDKADESIEEKEEEKSETDVPIELKRIQIIYKTASNNIQDVNYIIGLFNIAKNYKNTEKLQHQIIGDLTDKYSNKPQMWDFMARRELEGFSYNPDDENMEVDGDDNDDSSTSIRDRINSCNEVYQAAVKRLKSETMWSLYIDCLIEINHDLSTLPNYKRKLLKNALLQGHQAKKLQEKYYLNWIDMLKGDKNDDKTNEKIYQVLTYATDAIPQSSDIWRKKINHLIKTNSDNDIIDQEFTKAIEILGNNSLPIWKMKLPYYQARFPNKVEDIFKSAIMQPPEIAKLIKVPYIEWTILTKGIEAARQKYQELSVLPPLCLELHKRMADLEILQPNICKINSRKPHEMSALQFGKNNIEVWLDYILFEMKHGDPMKVTDIHRRAVKTLEPAKTDQFITQYSLLLANI